MSAAGKVNDFLGKVTIIEVHVNVGKNIAEKKAEFKFIKVSWPKRKKLNLKRYKNYYNEHGHALVPSLS